MSSDPAPPPPSRIGAAILLIFGIILLLPGICSLITAGIMVSDGGLKVFADPYTIMFMFVWGICGLIAWGGIAMIRAANRRFTVRAPRDA
jgi:hypothetical protein